MRSRPRAMLIACRDGSDSAARRDSRGSSAEQVVHDEIDELDPNEGEQNSTEAVDEEVPAQQRGRTDGSILHAAKRERYERRDDEGVEDDRRENGALGRAEAHDV